VLLALLRILTASDGVPDFGDTPSNIRITEFDAPGATNGTVPYAINAAGTVTGYYYDSNNVIHSFVRSVDGTFAEFDAPGGGTGTYQGTLSLSINLAGAVTGLVIDSNNVNHGFLRYPDGTFAATIDAPGAGTGPFQGTIAENINPTDVIAGDYIDASSVWHGFVRTPDPGSMIIPFDAPGAGTGPNQGTLVGSVDNLNSMGAISGTSVDPNNVFHGYLRAPDGTFTVFDAPGAGTGPNQGTESAGINDAGTIEGFYIDSNGVNRGFVRTPDPGSTITPFDVPGAGTGPNQGTVPSNINASGAIIGQYIDSNGVNHGFVRSPNGSFTTFDAPGGGTGSGQGTTPACNNGRDTITGWYVDSNGVNHGFLAEPRLPRLRPTPAPRP
jgi:hypothetical protein